LQIANKIGFCIPQTFIKTKLNKQDFEVPIITKPMSNFIHLKLNDKNYMTYTSVVDKNNKNKKYAISLFQQKIEKELELRVFYLDKKCYAVAILSQFDNQTSVDFRNYNYSNPNRIEYYNLPIDIYEKIILFMEHFNLQTGSLDFILDNTSIKQR